MATESYRVCRRAHSERGWGPWDDPASIPRNCVNAPSGWCWSTRREHPSQWAAIRVGRREARVHARKRLRRWVRQAERDAGQRPGLTTDERAATEAAPARNLRAEARERDPEESGRVFRPGGARPPSEVMVAFIDDHRDHLWGRADLRACCRSPRRRTFCTRPQQRDPTRRSARAQRDDVLRATFSASGREHQQVYGPRKVWRQLRRERSRVPRAAGPAADARDGPGGRGARPRVDHHDAAPMPRRSPGRSRRSPVHGDAAESALGRGLHVRGDVARLRLCRLRHRRLRPAHRRLARLVVAGHRLRARCARAGDLRPRGATPTTSCITAIAARSISRCATRDRLADAGIAPSVGSRGDSYDNALAESIIGLFKTEVIRRRDRGAISRPSNSRRWTGSTGSITVGCSNRLATCRRPSMKRATMSRPRWPDSR